MVGCSCSRLCASGEVSPLRLAPSGRLRRAAGCYARAVVSDAAQQRMSYQAYLALEARSDVKLEYVVCGARGPWRAVAADVTGCRGRCVRPRAPAGS
jgi:hypothetical protein